MTLIFGFSAVICSGLVGSFMSFVISTNCTRKRYQSIVQGSTQRKQEYSVDQQNGLLHTVMRWLKNVKRGDVFLRITTIQARLRELCGFKSAVLKFPPYRFEMSEWQRLSGLISCTFSCCAAIIVCTVFRNLLYGIVLGFCVFWILPVAYGSLSQRIKNDKRREYERSLSEMLSVIVLSVQAGATFDTAFEAYATNFSSALATQVKSTYELYISQVKSRNDALDLLAREVDSELFYHFVATVKRALYLGSPLGIALENQLKDIREYREEKIKEEIAKKPVQILLPLGVFILPGMLILLLGPILMEVMQGISMR